MATPKFDIESLIDRVNNLLTSNLNSKISAINSEKGGSIALSSIDSNAIFLVELSGTTINFNPFVLVTIEDVQTDAMPGTSADDIVLAVVVVMADNGNQTSLFRNLLRYQRALKEVFEENFSEIEGGIKFQMRSIAPQYLKLTNGTQFHRAAGVEIRATLC